MTIKGYYSMTIHRRQTSSAAADFLYHLKTKFPFRVKAIQIDGGSEFMDQFEEACRKADILLFLNPARRPQLNGGVERSNLIHREEFYEVEDVSLNLEEHNKQLANYEYGYNHIRPHWALELKTPYQYCVQWKKNHKTKVSPMPCPDTSSVTLKSKVDSRRKTKVDEK